MVISESSQHILDLCIAYNAAEAPQDKAALSKNLKKSLLALINFQLPIKGKQTNFSAVKLYFVLLESLDDGDVLQLCEKISVQKSARDVVNEHLAEVAAVLQESQAYKRNAENVRLVELLNTYRATGGESKAETEALYAALITTMQRLAYAIVKKKNWEAGQNELENHVENIINKVVDSKWSCGARLLHGWNEDLGAGVVSWLYLLLDRANTDLWRKEKSDKEWLVYEPVGNHNDEGKPETGLIGNIPFRGKTQSSLIRVGQLESRLDGFIDEMVGKSVMVDGKYVSLEEEHAKALRFRLKNPEITDWQLGEKLGVSKATAGRRKLAVEAYIAAHPSRDELLELLQPCSRDNGTPTIVKINIHESPLDWAYNKEEARKEGDA